MFYTDKALCVFLFFALIPGHICSARIKYPTVLISILARNKAHTLPYFLSSLERLNYPKERIALRIRSDHNIDNTVEILEKWIISVQHQYHSINSEYVDSDSYSDEQGPNDWSKLRFENVISLRESALNYAKTIWADYLLTLDCDVFLTNKDVLHYLIAKNLTVVAPMLKSSGLYSNFWFGMTDDYYYLRTGDYKPVVNREKLGCFETRMVHTCVLIDLRKIESDRLTYVPENIEGYDGPRDDIITFAIAANKSDIALTVCNEELFGFLMIPLEQDDTIAFDMLQLTNVKLEVLNEQEKLYVRDDLVEYTVLPEKDTLNFDRIFMINLLRRPERRKRMLDCFDELGLDVTILDAVDGKALNETALRHIKFLPNYADPYHKRMFIAGKVAIITGGVSGIGFSSATELLRNGLKAVTLADTDDAKGEEAVAKISNDFGGDKVLFVKTDVSIKEQFQNAFKQTVDKFGNIDILVNNAGIMIESIWEKMVAINVNGTIHGCFLGMEEYFPKYKSGDEAVIVNVSSIAGFQESSIVPVYVATKHAVVGFSRSLSTPDQYESSKTRIVTICPGFTDTPMMQEWTKKALNDRYRELTKKFIEVVKFPLQTTEAVAQGLVKAIEEGGNGSMWCVEDGEVFEMEFPNRAMTMGEIGCFLSHYNIWKEIVHKGYDSILVLEDDIRFEPFFRSKVQNLMQEVHQLGDWDLIYFGRKRLQENDEPFLPGSKYLVEAGYSYWTLGYVLSYQGAKKLLDADPLSRLVPVDEYLPILFDKHPQEEWKSQYPVRNLKAYSAAPLLLYPTHYTGEKGYISDTEDSKIVKEVAPRDDL